MAEYNINNPEDLIECPYEKAHMIRACRMQYHLIKCRKQHDATEFVTCPFNARHEVYKVEARYHQATCPDRTRIVHILAHSNEDSDTALKGCTDLPTYKPKRPHHHGGESWEDDIPSNPRVGVDTNLLERRHHYEEPRGRQAPNTVGLTALERRELYLEQQQAAAKEEETPQLRRPHNPSQAYAIHMQQQQQLQQQEQQQQQQQQNIYQFVLQKQKEMAVAAGRGSSIQGSVSSQPHMNGATVAAPRPGLGRGVLGVRPGMAGVLSAGTGDGDAGRGVAAGYPAMGRACALNAIRPSMLSHSSELISQPPCLTFSVGRGQTFPMNNNANNEVFINNVRADMNGQGSQFSLNSPGRTDSGAVGESDLESEEDGQFADTPAWVGGGYSGYSPFKEGGFSGGFRSAFAVGDAPGAYPGFATPQTSSSGTSLVIPSGSEASMVSSTEEAQRSLKRVRKMLRQIDTLEKKRERGIKLNADEESKLSRKWALRTEEEELQTQLEVLSVD